MPTTRHPVRPPAPPRPARPRSRHQRRHYEPRNSVHTCSFRAAPPRRRCRQRGQVHPHGGYRSQQPVPVARLPECRPFHAAPRSPGDPNRRRFRAEEWSIPADRRSISATGINPLTSMFYKLERHSEAPIPADEKHSSATARTPHDIDRRRRTHKRNESAEEYQRVHKQNGGRISSRARD